ncbi:MAG: tRNA (adenosine(37)-N6)-dimethylallyltransferase MiaA [Muribaculaceae bacterium]|nr:tRNA (adenosine(37)-N6)-dimethylallyltransferase MiaA [Muribaculaceae bacterium]
MENKRNNFQSNDITTRGHKPRVVIVTGTTASGKTKLAIELAKQLDTDIISADSRQIYRGIPITTAVPSLDEQDGIAHHLLEFLELNEYYSAAQFAADAKNLITEAADRGKKYVIICGGSMMYIDALMYGLDDLPEISAEVRDKVRRLHSDLGLEGLLAFLEVSDPDYYNIVDKANTKRVMHALEITMEAGVPYSTLRTGTKQTQDFDCVKFAISHPREVLFDRINRRVDEMVKSGMEEEARRVFPYRHLNSLNTVGFKEWFAHFDGLMDRHTAIERIKKNTRVYAKKQLTWLKKDMNVHWVPGNNAFAEIMAELRQKA